MRGRVSRWGFDSGDVNTTGYGRMITLGVRR